MINYAFGEVLFESFKNFLRPVSRHLLGSLDQIRLRVLGGTRRTGQVRSCLLYRLSYGCACFFQTLA